jgi:hypothetical protein
LYTVPRERRKGKGKRVEGRKREEKGEGKERTEWEGGGGKEVSVWRGHGCGSRHTRKD